MTVTVVIDPDYGEDDDLYTVSCEGSDEFDTEHGLTRVDAEVEAEAWADHLRQQGESVTIRRN